MACCDLGNFVAAQTQRFEAWRGSGRTRIGVWRPTRFDLSAELAELTQRRVPAVSLHAWKSSINAWLIV
jgi:hypothetical protein